MLQSKIKNFCDFDAIPTTNHKVYYREEIDDSSQV
jgi:hypothetical protein